MEYLGHGRRHSGMGTDPPLADWVYISDTPATAWDSGTSYAIDDTVSHDVYNYIARTASTNKEPRVDPNWRNYWMEDAPLFQNGWTNSGGTYVPLRFRFLPAKDSESGQVGIELQGSVTGGSDGSVIFTLPVSLDYDLHLSASDDSGAFVVFTVQQSGDVLFGFV